MLWRVVGAAGAIAAGSAAVLLQQYVVEAKTHDDDEEQRTPTREEQISTTREVRLGNVMYGHGKLDYIFPSVPKKRRRLLALDTEAYYSTTDEKSADAMTALLACFVEQEAPVLDATSCLGGNTYSLQKLFCNTYALELEQERLPLLEHNLRVLGAKGVYVLQGDAAELHRKPNQNITACQPLALQTTAAWSTRRATIQELPRWFGAVVADPPWDGIDYDEKDIKNLKLSNIDLADWVIEAAGVTPVVMCKVPYNYDFQSFFNKLRNHTLQCHEAPRPTALIHAKLEKFDVLLVTFSHPKGQQPAPPTPKLPRLQDLQSFRDQFIGLAVYQLQWKGHELFDDMARRGTRYQKAPNLSLDVEPF